MFITIPFIRFFGYGISFFAFGIGFLIILGNVLFGGNWILYIVVASTFFSAGIISFLQTKNIKFLEKIPASKNFFKYDVLEQYAIFLVMFGFFVMLCYRILGENFSIFG
ncbi:hypothetical protein BLM37_01770 [Candidatus Gracilibacteria bacterium GN02-873]|nr:hypothetical protein BLM37_01770 [Candidatus Gracilibacteria bacterium GN02-873]